MSKQLTWREIRDQLNTLDDGQLDRPAMIGERLERMNCTTLFIVSDVRIIDDTAGTLSDGKRGDGNDGFAEMDFPWLGENESGIKKYLNDGNFFLVVESVASSCK
jgi:hypothetical protein